MKRKQKFAPPDGFESDCKGSPIPVQTNDFDWAKVYKAVDNKADAIPSIVTRDQLEANLKKRGLSRVQRAVALAFYLDHKTTREIAKDFGKSHTWVINTLKRIEGHKLMPMATSEIGLSQAVQQSREADKKAENDFLRENPTGSVIVLHEPTLTDAMRHAHEVLANFQGGPEADAGYGAFAFDELAITPKSSEAELVIATIAVRPELLLQPNGRQLLEKFVELVRAARYGKKADAAAARKALKLLNRAGRGNRCQIPDKVMDGESVRICIVLKELQQAWREFSHDPVAARLDGIRELIGDGHIRFNNWELQSLMTTDLLTASARVAEKATGIAAESFRRVWKKHSPDCFSA